MSALKKELEALAKIMDDDSPEFENTVNSIAERYTTAADKRQIADFVAMRLSKVDRQIDRMTVKLQLAEISEIISLSWMAKKYFGKSKSWLYQRMNNNVVNGKPCSFTDAEIATFNHALRDISQKIGSISITS